MKKSAQRGIGLLLTLVLLFGLSTAAAAAVPDSMLTNAMTDTAKIMYQTVKEPQVGSVGGEWAVLGLARSSYDVPETYFQNYYATVETYVKERAGKLHDKKYTEYSRVIVALSSLGKDARNVAGYNLLTALGDYDKTVWQGINGPIWALIALDSAGYPMPENPDAKTQATRQMYIDRILECQLPDGGWSLYGGTAAEASGGGISDPDLTGMALQALAKYQDQPAVAQAIQEALDCMSAQQDTRGGFSSWGAANSESVVQMIVALCELGVPLDDTRFVKNGNTMLDNLLTYYRPGEGFLHTANDDGVNQMATEQALYALAAAQRAQSGQNSLYRMDDALEIPDAVSTGPALGKGLVNKDPAVQPVPVTKPDVTVDTFTDIAASSNSGAIIELASRGIVDGRGEGLFDPDTGMTRAEFATIAVRALGLTPEETDAFTDVDKGVWFAPYVGTAYKFGLIEGRGSGLFDPNSTITRQEAAVLVARAAKLCGMETQMDAAAVRDVLAQFGDYVTTAAWARESLAFCYSSGILDESDLEIQPLAAILRGEMAQMLYNLLEKANLL